MSQTSTPIKVPASAATYTPATLDADLRSQIHAILIRDGHIKKIQDHLLHTLEAHPSNWTSTIQSHGLSLLRSGEISTFPALVQRVLEDVRSASLPSSSSPSSSSSNNTKKSDESSATATTNGVSEKDKDGKGKNGVNGAAAVGNGAEAGLALPTQVVEEVLKATRESLEAVCRIEDGGREG